MITQRCTDGILYYFFHKRTAPRTQYRLVNTGAHYTDSALYRAMNLAHSVFMTLENVCLMLLTYVSSTDDYAKHEFGFIAFLVCAHINMILNLWLFHAKSPLSPSLLRSFRYKQAFYAAQCLLTLSAAYFFVRHQSHCEPGVYSWFAACEYLLVGANIAFHYTFVMDIPHARVGFTLEG
jgi:hypothetical protein